MDAAGNLAGTGFFVSADGLIVTCHHVAEEACAGRPFVLLPTEPQPIPATIQQSSDETDLTILHIDRADCQPLPLSSQWVKGMEVSSYGYEPGDRVEFPNGKPTSQARLNGLTKIKVDGGRRLECLSISPVDIGKGFSGAPTLNDAGHVVGILTRISQRPVPSDQQHSTVKWLATHLKSKQAYAIPTADLLTLARELAEVLPRAMKPPYRTLPENTRTTPSILLRAESEVVPFRGRADEFAELNRWCLEGGPGVKVRLVAGQGGTGKTRLAAELATWCRDQHRWIAGFLRDDSAEQSASLAALHRCGRPVLIIIDYADTRTDQIKHLLNMLVVAEPATEVRLLLLVRVPSDWWSRGDSSLTDLAHDEGSQPVVLRSLETTAEGKKEAFDAAVTAFLKHRRGDAGIQEPSDVTMPLLEKLDSVLAIHLAAYVSLYEDLHTTDEPALQGLIDHLLDHERRYWKPAPIDDFVVLDRAVAAATMCGADSEQQAVDLLKRIPDLTESNSVALHSLARWLRERYPADEGYLAPLQPDRLGERLVAKVIESRPDLPDLLLNDADTRQSEQALTLLDRASVEHPSINNVLLRLLRNNPSLAPTGTRIVLEGRPTEGGLRYLLAGDYNYRITTSPPRRPIRTLITVGVALALALAIGFGAGVVFTTLGAEAPATQGGPSTTPSGVIATTTTTPTTTTTTSQSTRPRPSGGPTPGGNVLYTEGFNSPDSCEGDPADKDKTFTCDAGRLRIKAQIAADRYLSDPSFPARGSLRAQVDIDVPSGTGSVGIAFVRLTPARQRGGYQAIVNGDGTWLLRRLVGEAGGNTAATVLGTPPSNSDLPLHGKHQISLEVLSAPQGGSVRLQLFLDGTKLDEVDDAPGIELTFDNIGLSASSSEGVIFDNLVVTKF